MLGTRWAGGEVGRAGGAAERGTGQGAREWGQEGAYMGAGQGGCQWLGARPSTRGEGGGQQAGMEGRVATGGLACWACPLLRLSGGRVGQGRAGRRC